MTRSFSAGRGRRGKRSIFSPEFLQPLPGSMRLLACFERFDNESAMSSVIPAITRLMLHPLRLSVTFPPCILSGFVRDFMAFTCERAFFSVFFSSGGMGQNR